MKRFVLISIISILALLLNSCTRPPVKHSMSLPTQGPYLKRGVELVNGLAACGYCHGESAEPNSSLIGGNVKHDRYGEVKAANLTPSNSGLGDWTVSEFFNALRTSQSKDGDRISSDVHRGAEWMSDEDMYAIISYLRAVPPIDNQVERRPLSFVTRNTSGFFEQAPKVPGYVPVIPKRYVKEYGQYLTESVARCTMCHNLPGTLFSDEQYLSGGAEIKAGPDSKLAPSISSSRTYGIGNWQEEEIVHYLKTGITPDKRITDPAFCPTNFYRNAAEDDLIAIARYLLDAPSGE